MNQESYFVIVGLLQDGIPVYKTEMRTRPNAWSSESIDAKKYNHRKTAEGAINSKGVTLYSVGIKDIKVEEILPSDSRHIQAGYSTR
jgi:hypothetical protein